ncbi:heme-binding protein 2-like [Dendropsophus ebraccatus]|uniref:heme-binding protein 2-like n=1 Tax=Dendropsophus ebraccatus TaxID=150705 RepID=UPI0038315008
MEGRSALYLGLLSVIGIAVTAQASDVSDHNQRPVFCGDNDCPKYQLVKQYEGFEHRKYDATQWISTSVLAGKQSINIGFWNIFQYFNGSNSAGLKMKPTVPLVIMVPGNQTVNLTMSAFLSESLKNPPKPLKSTLSLHKYPEASLYVRSFGGFASKEDFATHISALAEELTTLDLPFDDSFVACNIYDPPEKRSDRHNEVWLLAIKK